MQPNFPTINFNETLIPGTPCWISKSKEIQRALEEYGFFEAAYDKITTELQEKMFGCSKELFDLPIDMKVKNTSSVLGFGYGGDFKNLLIEYSGIENGATLEGTQDFTKLMWPSENDPFCETTFLYSKLLSELGQLVIRMAFESYGVEKYCDSHFGSINFLFRFMKYTPPINGLNIGLPPHTDKSFWTILDQNHVKGLEIQMKHGEWLTYERKPSTFLFIAGEPFMAWSNGRVHPASHQVVMSGDDTKYTMGLFAFMRGTVEVPKELEDDEHPLLFKPFNHFSFLDYCVNEGKTLKSPIHGYCGV